MSFMQSLPRPVSTYHTSTYDRIAKQHSFDGRGKTVMITGGAGGVGYAIAESFAAADVAHIIITSRSQGQQEEASQKLKAEHPAIQVTTFVADIKDHDEMDRIIRGAGPIDVLILNAAVAHRRAQATDITIEEMSDAFETNTTATFNIAKAFLRTPSLTKSGEKTIINVSAAVAHFVNPYRVAYAASKAAAVQILQSIVSQYQQSNDENNVKIVSFHPGSLYTPGVAANIPKDMMEWDDIRLPADFAVWLASPESSFLNGKFVWAAWDVDELIALKDKIKDRRDFLTIGLVQ